MGTARVQPCTFARLQTAASKALESTARTGHGSCQDCVTATQQPPCFFSFPPDAAKSTKDSRQALGLSVRRWEPSSLLSHRGSTRAGLSSWFLLFSAPLFCRSFQDGLFPPSVLTTSPSRLARFHVMLPLQRGFTEEPVLKYRRRLRVC